MKKQRTIRRTLLAMAVAALGVSATALAQTNIPEPPGTPDVSGDFYNPQPLDVNVGTLGVVSVTSWIRNPSITSPDVDFFSFVVSEEWVNKPEAERMVAADIDEAHDGTATGLDTTLHVFNPDGVMVMRGFITDPADANSTPVPGSTSTRDPSLKFLLNKAGIWRIAVTAHPAMLTDFGNFTTTGMRATSNGSYKLVVSGLQPSMQQIDVEIKPGSKEIGHINPKSRGMIPVMLMSSKDKGFNPFDVEEASLKFGPKGNETSFGRCQKQGADHNGDGIPDRVCHFDNEKTGFKPGDAVGIVTGTVRGKAFEGRGDLKVHEKGAD